LPEPQTRFVGQAFEDVCWIDWGYFHDVG
jgi:hypothetical protein